MPEVIPEIMHVITIIAMTPPEGMPMAAVVCDGSESGWTLTPPVTFMGAPVVVIVIVRPVAVDGSKGLILESGSMVGRCS